MDITEFLKARITEDEAQAQEAIEERARVAPDAAAEGPDMGLQSWPDVGVPAVLVGPERILADCAAKREIIEEHYSRMEEGQQGCVLCGHYTLDYGWEETGPCKTIRALAAVYNDHPDYQPEWTKTSQVTPKNT